MRIAIDGTHSTGKTTLWNILKIDKTYRNFKFIPEIGSVIAKRDYSINSPIGWMELFKNKKKYSNFIDVLLKKQIHEENINNNFIADSSIYRICAYAIINNVIIPDDILCNPFYDIIFYCPIEFDFIEDEFRYDFSRENVDKKLRELLEKHHKGKIIPLTGIIQDRLALISDSIIF